MNKKTILGFLAASALGVTAQANNVTVELALCIDGSGSIGSLNFDLQKQGYINALTALLPIDGSVAVGVWRFASSVSLIFDERIIDSAQDKTDLLNALNSMVYPAGSTLLNSSIVSASIRLGNNDITGLKQIIDVSTDGVNNGGANLATAWDTADANGIDQINGLLVGSSTSSAFVHGTGSFFIAANDFGDFEAAITQKLQVEIVGVPDGGATSALLGFGLLAFSGMRRRLNAA